MVFLFLCLAVSLSSAPIPKGIQKRDLNNPIEKKSIDLEEKVDSFVIETKQISIPSYPHAFNPSLVRWKGRLLLSFRILPDPKNSFASQIGLVWLNEEFEPLDEPQILDLRNPFSDAPPRAEDGRLIEAGGRLYLVYSDNQNEVISKGGFRLFVSELMGDFDTGIFFDRPIRLSRFEGENSSVREKNWVPFECSGELFLAYSLSPHKIFKPRLNIGECDTVAISDAEIVWSWGELRGGTPALKIGDEYLSFFHSSKKIETVHSDKKNMLHYMMGAYTFSLYWPFEITRMSPEPIVAKGFYKGTVYPTYKNWSSMRGIFPGGFVFNNEFIWVVYGRQDHEMWVVKLDKKGLLESLRPVRNRTVWEVGD